MGKADGAFAVAIHHSIYQELIQEITKFNMPFDSGPLKYIQRKYPYQCYVFYPNLIIADITESDCRPGRNQITAGNLLKWNIADYIFQKNKIETNHMVSVILYIGNYDIMTLQSLESILKQSYTNLEIIIIMDYYDSNFEEKIITLKKNYKIILLVNDTPCGKYISWNQGLQHVHGDFITFQEQYFHAFNNRIETQLYFLLNQEKISAVCCQGIPFNSEHKTIIESSIFFRKELISNVGFFDNCKYGGLFNFYQKIMSKHHIFSLNKQLLSCLANFNENQNNLQNEIFLEKLFTTHATIKDSF